MDGGSHSYKSTHLSHINDLAIVFTLT